MTRRGRLSSAAIPGGEWAPMTWAPLASLARKTVHLLHRAVEGHDGEAVVVHVQNQVLAHDGQTDQRNVSFWFHKISSRFKSVLRLKKRQGNLPQISVKGNPGFGPARSAPDQTPLRAVNPPSTTSSAR